MKLDIVFNTQFSENLGYGHLKRTLYFYDILKKNFKCKVTVIKKSSDKILDVHNFQNNRKFLDFIKENKTKLVILDYRYYNTSFVKQISQITKVMIIDSPGMFKLNNPILYLNLLTPLKIRYFQKNQFYYKGLQYYPFEKSLSKLIDSKPKDEILISFGNSDPHNLTLKIFKKLNGLESIPKVNVVIGKHFGIKADKIRDFLNNKFVHTYKIIDSSDSIYNYIADNRYLITSFGLTFIEGLVLGRNIALYNNSRYHAYLASVYNGYFENLGTYPFPISVTKLDKFVKSKDLKKMRIDLNTEKRIYGLINDFIKADEFEVENRCRICNGNTRLVLNEMGKKIYECRKCSVKYLTLTKKVKAEERYKSKYFTDEYKEQYGVTYIEDRKNIERLAEKRLSRITRLIKPDGKTLLDIGCAYGFFLKKAEGFGFDVEGIEIEKKAVEYGRKKLGLNIHKGNILNFKINRQFDVITMWYVMEHFSQPDVIVDIVKRYLKHGGIVVLGIPNGKGAFYRFNRRLWLETHSDDHFYDYSYKSIKILFKGFRVLKYVSTGIHPERIGVKNKIFAKVLGQILKLLKLGDTMEIYLKV